MLNDFLDYNFDLSKGPIFTKWMKGARTNICYNALDRHVHNGLGDRIAYYWYVLSNTKKYFIIIRIETESI